MSNSDHVASQRHWHMCDSFDQMRLINRAIEVGEFADGESATAAIDALLQWLALHSHSSDMNEMPIVMMAGPVAQMYECFRTDGGNYNGFCRRYYGHTLQQIPITSTASQNYVTEQGWPKMTLAKLAAVFGADLSPLLADWSTLRRFDDIVFVGIFNDQLHKHPKLACEQVLHDHRARPPLSLA